MSDDWKFVSWMNNTHEAMLRKQSGDARVSQDLNKALFEDEKPSLEKLEEEIYFRNQANLKLVRLIDECDRRNWERG